MIYGVKGPRGPGSYGPGVRFLQYAVSFRLIANYHTDKNVIVNQLWF